MFSNSVCMQNVIVVLLFAIVGTAVADEKASTLEDRLKRELETPKRIPTPKDIPSYEEITDGRTGEKFMFFPVAAYQKMYYEAWNERLYQYGFLNLDPDLHIDCLTALPIEPYSGRAVAEGLIECRKRILALRKKHGDVAVRRASRQAYNKRQEESFLQFGRSGKAPENQSKETGRHTLQVEWNEKNRERNGVMGNGG